MQEAGFFDRQPLYYAMQFTLLFAMMGGSIAGVILLQPFILKLLCAIPMTMSVLQASYLSHDLGHRQVFETARANDRGLLLISLFIGASRAWWIDTHNQHHVAPNDPELDPNLRVPFLAFSKEQADSYTGLTRTIMRFQGLYFWVFVAFEALAMKIHSFRYLMMTPTASYRRLEMGLILAHAALYLALVALTMTWWQAAIFLGVQHILNGLHIGLVFAPNHKGMPLLNEVEAQDFLTQQVVTTRNVKHFPFATCLVGGLHFQIEHHLFTNMPRNKLRAARLLIKPYCEEKGISYVETGLIESYVRVSSSFTDVARA